MNMEKSTNNYTLNINDNSDDTEQRTERNWAYIHR